MIGTPYTDPATITQRRRKKRSTSSEKDDEYARVMAARGEPLKQLSSPPARKPQARILQARLAKQKRRKKKLPQRRLEPPVTIRRLDLDVRPKKVYSTPQGQAYEKYINSEAWAARRRAYWSQAGYSCKATDCSKKKNLHVHHHTYERLGDELLTDLVGLCAEHHDAVHAHHKKHRQLTLTQATAEVTGLAL